MEEQKEKIKKEQAHFSRLLKNAKDGLTKERIQTKLSELQRQLHQIDADRAPLSADGRSLAALPSTQTLYVAAELRHARALDEAGYPALWLTDPGLLEQFTGSDIVLTEPGLHSLAFDLGGRYLVQRAECWVKGKLDVVGTVPMMTHLLTLAESLDLVPVATAAEGKKAKAVYEAFGAGDELRYRRMVRQLGAA